MAEIHFNPEAAYALNVSGGRTSGYMLYQLWPHIKGRDVIPVFMNTGLEREETLRFVDELDRDLKAGIRWIEFYYDDSAKGVRGDPKKKVRITNYRTASREGEPFLQLINSRKYLPNPVRRLCTSELKVLTAERYMKALYPDRPVINILGIRKDENKRAVRLFDRDCNVICPLYDAGVTGADVREFWESHRYDLELPYDNAYGNCDLCFLKGKRNLARLIRAEPDRIHFWLGLEQRTGATFNKNYSYADLLDLSRQGELFDDVEMNVFSCFCGD